MKLSVPNQKYLLPVLLVAAAACSRLIPHPSNFTAIGAMALFSGAIFRDKRLAFLLPMAAMMVTDLALGFHASMLPVYSCFALTVGIGILIRNYLSPVTIAAGSIVSSVLFFLVTNLPFWYADISLYPLTWAGTVASYTAALPFFGNQLSGDLIFNILLFGSYYLINKRVWVAAR
jgi:hypothetical protein